MNNMPGSGIVLQDGHGNSISRTAETSTAALAASAEAEVKASYIMALERPRNVAEARIRLLQECDRPGFAFAALYSKPQGGKKVEGLTAGFALAALRCWRNANASAQVVADDVDKVMYKVSAVDLESNTRNATDIVITKLMERHDCKGEIPVRTRQNAAGETVYILRADEEALRGKINGEISRARRNMILSLIPSDIKDDCLAVIRETRSKKDAADPGAVQKQVFDGFATLNVMPSDLEKYLGHKLDIATPAEMADLRDLFLAIREGELTWAEVAKADGDPEVENKKQKIRERGKKKAG